MSEKCDVTIGKAWEERHTGVHPHRLTSAILGTVRPR